MNEYELVPTVYRDDAVHKLFGCIRMIVCLMIKFGGLIMTFGTFERNTRPYTHPITLQQDALSTSSHLRSYAAPKPPADVIADCGYVIYDTPTLTLVPNKSFQKIPNHGKAPYMKEDS